MACLISIMVSSLTLELLKNVFFILQILWLFRLKIDFLLFTSFALWLEKMICMGPAIKNSWDLLYRLTCDEFSCIFCLWCLLFLSFGLGSYICLLAPLSISCNCSHYAGCGYLYPSKCNKVWETYVSIDFGHLVYPNKARISETVVVI